jgi:hypothetical protein
MPQLRKRTPLEIPPEISKRFVQDICGLSLPSRTPSSKTRSPRASFTLSMSIAVRAIRSFGYQRIQAKWSGDAEQ